MGFWDQITRNSIIDEKAFTVEALIYKTTRVTNSNGDKILDV